MTTFSAEVFQQSNAVFGLNPASISAKSPVLLEQLFENCRYNFEYVSSLIDPILQASQRCQVTTLYILAIDTGHTAFITTNVNTDHQLQIFPDGSSWLIGSAVNCAISIPHSGVSRCHAALGYLPNAGFYLTDIGSEQGTRINRHRIKSLDRRSLKDGDLIELGDLRIEFFLTKLGEELAMDDEPTAF